LEGIREIDRLNPGDIQDVDQLVGRSQHLICSVHHMLGWPAQFVVCCVQQLSLLAH